MPEIVWNFDLLNNNELFCIQWIESFQEGMLSGHFAVQQTQYISSPLPTEYRYYYDLLSL